MTILNEKIMLRDDEEDYRRDAKEEEMNKIFDKLTVFLSELLGTGFLVFLGCMGCIKWSSADNHAGASFNFGLQVGVLIQIFGCISGAHLNPAVSVGALIYRVLSIQMFVIYIVAQVLGAFMGFGILKVVVPSYAIRADNSTDPGLCTTMPHPDVSPFQATVVEFLAVFILVSLCCSVWDPRNANQKDSTSIKFGICIAILIYTIGPITGGSVNPARSLAPAIWNGDYDNLWVYWVGPILAGAVASFLYKNIFWRDVQKSQSIPQYEDK